MRLLLLVLLAACVPAAESPRVVDCTARYQACVAASTTMIEYTACRAGVDLECLR